MRPDPERRPRHRSLCEIAVLHHVRRTATVVARSAAAVLSVPGEAVRTAVRTHGGEGLAALLG